MHVRSAGQSTISGSVMPWKYLLKHSVQQIGKKLPNEIKLRSEAKSLFDVQRWMFDLPAMP
jgi:hypothetical protein